jgi:hypothetical protein
MDEVQEALQGEVQKVGRDVRRTQKAPKELEELGKL